MDYQTIAIIVIALVAAGFGVFGLYVGYKAYQEKNKGY